MAGRKWRGVTQDDMPGRGEEQRYRRFEVLKGLSSRPRTTREITTAWQRRVRGVGWGAGSHQDARDLSSVRSDLCALRHWGLANKLPRSGVNRQDRWTVA